MLLLWEEEHIAEACRKTRKIENKADTGGTEELLNGLQDNCSQQKAIIRVKIDEEEIPMEIDTGASVSIVPSSMCKKKLESLTKKLRSATGQLMKLAGQTVVNVQVEGETKQLKLYVTCHAKTRLMRF